LILRSPLFRKLLASAVVLIAVTVLVLDFYITGLIGRNEAESIEQRLEAQARILAGEALQVPPGELRLWAHEAGERALARVTVIDRNGGVAADSEHDPESMEPHGTRSEVIDALHGRVGIAIRHSRTLGRDLCYLAYPMRNGAVLRLSLPLRDIDAAVRAVRMRIVLVSMLAGGLALAIAYYVSRSLTRRIRRIQSFAEGLLEAGSPKELLPDSADELGDLAVSLSRMARQLDDLIERLRLETARLERVERVRKDFVANVSHELRTPLTAIRGYAETLLDGALEDQENNRRFLEIIKAHTIRLNNIASDLLTLSELESGRSVAEPEPVFVRGVLETAVRAVEAQAAVQNVRVICARVEDFEVTGYRIRLEQALVNLIDNAVKFNKPGGEVRIEATRGPGGTARISVSDTGVGIPREDLSRIFERFYRVDKARSREVGGTGLGLSIVRHAIERMNGSVTVHSEVGGGSTFTITLPCRAPEMAGIAM
jgi:two-component system phosphate regulon sensor histidine kinase PhoR